MLSVIVMFAEAMGRPSLCGMAVRAGWRRICMTIPQKEAVSGLRKAGKLGERFAGELLAPAGYAVLQQRHAIFGTIACATAHNHIL